MVRWEFLASAQAMQPSISPENRLVVRDNVKLPLQFFSSERFFVAGYSPRQRFPRHLPASLEPPLILLLALCQGHANVFLIGFDIAQGCGHVGVIEQLHRDVDVAIRLAHQIAGQRVAEPVWSDAGTQPLNQFLIHGLDLILVHGGAPVVAGEPIHIEQLLVGPHSDGFRRFHQLFHMGKVPGHDRYAELPMGFFFLSAYEDVALQQVDILHPDLQ